MDVDAFVLAHSPAWDRLEELTRRRRTLTGAEIDELVDLYQRVSTHLSMVRSATSDAVLVGRLSGLIARARAAITGERAPLRSEFVRFWTVSFPVVAYDYGAAREHLCHGVHGAAIACGDESAFVAAVTALGSDMPRLRAMGRAARAAVAGLSPGQVAADLDRLLAGLRDGQRSHAHLAA